MFIIVFLILFFRSTTSIWANSTIFISEVLPNPSVSPEWIELYNPTSNSIDLSNWTIADETSFPNPIATIDGFIEPEQTLILELNNNYLNNSGDTIYLLNPDKDVINQMSYSSSTANLSWSRSLPTADPYQTEPNPNQIPIAASPSPTPSVSPSPIGSPSPSPISQVDSSQVTITEVFSCPETGQQEWIEIRNSASQNIELKNWKIRDTQQNLVTMNLTLPANSTSIFSWPQSILNNSGDAIYVLDATEELILDLQIPSCRSQSFALIQGNWLLTVPTPGSANILLPAVAATSEASPNPLSNSPSPSPATDNKDHQKDETKLKTKAVPNYTWPTLSLEPTQSASASSKTTGMVKRIKPPTAPKSISIFSFVPAIGLAALGTVLMLISSKRLWSYYKTQFDSKQSFDDFDFN